MHSKVSVGDEESEMQAQIPLQSSVKIGEVHQISSMGKSEMSSEKIWMTEVKMCRKFREMQVPAPREVYLNDRKGEAAGGDLSDALERTKMSPMRLHLRGQGFSINKKKKKMHFHSFVTLCFIDFSILNCLSGKFPYCRTAGAGTQGISDGGLRERRATLHAALETGEQQHRSAAAPLVHSFSMSSSRQVCALLDDGHQTEPAVGRSLQVGVKISARPRTPPLIAALLPQQLGQRLQGARAASRGSRELSPRSAPQARLHRRIHQLGGGTCCSQRHGASSASLRDGSPV